MTNLDRRGQCQFCPLVPQAKFLDSGGFLNLIEIIGGLFVLRVMLIGYLKNAASSRLSQLGCLNYFWTIKLPQTGCLKKAQVASRRLLLRQHQDDVLHFLGIILFWFLTHSDWFLKRAWDNWELLCVDEGGH